MFNDGACSQRTANQFTSWQGPRRPGSSFGRSRRDMDVQVICALCPSQAEPVVLFFSRSRHTPVQFALECNGCGVCPDTTRPTILESTAQLTLREATRVARYESQSVGLCYLHPRMQISPRCVPTTASSPKYAILDRRM